MSLILNVVCEGILFSDMELNRTNIVQSICTDYYLINAWLEFFLEELLASIMLKNPMLAEIIHKEESVCY